MRNNAPLTVLNQSGCVVFDMCLHVNFGFFTIKQPFVAVEQLLICQLVNRTMNGHGGHGDENHDDVVDYL